MKQKTFLLFCILLGLSLFKAHAQDLQKPLDKSPHDISYLRDKNKAPLIKVIYGRPQKKGREVFGGLESYGKIWRTGANEATEIRFYKDAKIAGKEIKAGTYTLFSIPNKTIWTIILNTELDQWGAYTYNPDKDVLKIDIPSGVSPAEIEAFTITFKQTEEGDTMILGWDKTIVEIPVKF